MQKSKDTTQRGPRENRLFAEWRASEGSEKEAALVRLIGALEKHARSICWSKMDDHQGEFSWIVNESIWRAIAQAEKFRGESRFSTWFHRIVLNECNRVLKAKRSAAKNVSIEGLNEDDGALRREPRSTDDIEVDQIIRGLDVEDRKHVEFRRLGFSEREIGEKLGLSESAVGVRWYRIKEQVRP